MAGRERPGHIPVVEKEEVTGSEGHRAGFERDF